MNNKEDHQYSAFPVRKPVKPVPPEPPDTPSTPTNPVPLSFEEHLMLAPTSDSEEEKVSSREPEY